MKPLLFAALLVAAPHFAKAETQAADDCGCNVAEAAAPDSVVAPTPGDDKVLLRLNLKPGQKYSYQLKADARTSSVSQAMRFDSQQTMRMKGHIEILSISPEGNVTVRYGFNDLQIDMKMTDGKGKTPIPVAEASKVLQPILNAMKKHALTVTLSPRAQVIKLDGTAEMIAAVMAAIPAKTAIERIQLKAMSGSIIKGITNSEGGINTMMVALPETPVGVGDAWQNGKTAQAFMVQMHSDNDYRVASRENGVLRAKIQTLISTPNDQKDAAMQLQGKQVGTLDLDEVTGMVRSGNIKTFMTSRIALGSEGKPDPRYATTVYNNGTATFFITLVAP